MWSLMEPQQELAKSVPLLCSHCRFHLNGTPSAVISLFRVSVQKYHCEGLATGWKEWMWVCLAAKLNELPWEFSKCDRRLRKAIWWVWIKVWKKRSQSFSYRQGFCRGQWPHKSLMRMNWFLLPWGPQFIRACAPHHPQTNGW